MPGPRRIASWKREGVRGEAELGGKISAGYQAPLGVGPPFARLCEPPGSPIQGGRRGHSGEGSVPVRRPPGGSGQ